MMLDAKDMATNVENHAKIHQNEAERLLKLQEIHKKITEKGRLRKEIIKKTPISGGSSKANSTYCQVFSESGMTPVSIRKASILIPITKKTSIVPNTPLMSRYVCDRKNRTIAT